MSAVSGDTTAMAAVGDGSRHDFASIRRDERAALPSLVPEFASQRKAESSAGDPLRSGMHLGRRATVFSPNRVWRPCVVVSERASPAAAVRVHYEGFHEQWDEWIQTDSARLRWAPADDPYSAAALEKRFSRSNGVPRALSKGDALRDAPDRFFEHLVVVDEAPPSLSGAAELGPQLVYQYPQDQPVGVQELGSFCLPHERGRAHRVADPTAAVDAWREYVVSPPRFGEESWVFSLQGESMSSPLYGICVAVPVPTDAPLSFSCSQEHAETACERSERDGKNAAEKRTLSRRCFCVLTYQPFFAFFTELLRQICAVEKTRWLQSGGEVMLWGVVDRSTLDGRAAPLSPSAATGADATPSEGVPPHRQAGPQPKSESEPHSEPECQPASLVECTFTEEGSLGLKLNEHSSGRGLVVRVNPGTQAEQHPQLCTGLLLRRVAGSDVSELSYSNLLSLLKASKQRPITLLFDADTNASDNADVEVGLHEKPVAKANKAEPEPEPEPQQSESEVHSLSERVIGLGDRVRVLPRVRAEVACGLVGIKWSSARAKRTGAVGTVVEAKGSGATLRLSVKFEDAIYDSDGQLLRTDSQSLVFPSAALELDCVGSTVAEQGGGDGVDDDSAANKTAINSVVNALAAAHAAALTGALDKLRAQSLSSLRVAWGSRPVVAAAADHAVEVLLEKSAEGTGLHISAKGIITSVRNQKARMAGAKEGAQICTVNGQPVATKDEIVREMSQVGVGETVAFVMLMPPPAAACDEVEVIDGSLSPEGFLSRRAAPDGDCDPASVHEYVFDYGVVSVRGRYPMPGELLVRINAASPTDVSPQALSHSEWLALMTAHSVAARYVPVAMRALSTKTILHMLSGLLLEQQIVVVSADLEKLTAVIQTLSLLLRPLRWQCPLVPVLPHRLLSFLDAPVPFLLGVPRPCEASGGDISKPMTALLSHIHGGGRPELLLVDADHDTVLRGEAAIAQEGSPVPASRLASETTQNIGKMALPGQRRLEDTLMPYGNCLRGRGQVSAAEIGWAVRGVITAFGMRCLAPAPFPSPLTRLLMNGYAAA